MKKLFILLTLLLSTTTFAGECVNDKGEDILNNPEEFQTLIKNSTSCYEAKDLAIACAWGSSMDVHTAGAAYDVCQNQLEKNNPAQNLLTVFASMKQLCSDKYDNMDGTMYRSMASYCYLDAVDFILNLTFEE